MNSSELQGFHGHWGSYLMKQTNKQMDYFYLDIWIHHNAILITTIIRILES